MKRPKRFDEVFGHNNIIQLLQARVNENTLPHFIILYGEEGLGKTTIARLLAIALTCESAEHKPCYECPSCKENQKQLIVQGKDSSNVFLYRMSVEGGKDVAKEMLSHINACMGKDVRVFIADEAQRMSSAAQDVLLHDTEHLPSKVFIIMCTTDITSISKTLLSRAVKFYLPHLSRSAMISLLLRDMRERHLTFPDASQAASIIGEVSEYKPREALSILEGLGNNRYVSYNELNNVLQLNDVHDFKELVSTFKTSITEGVSKIYAMDITYQTQAQLCRYIGECLKYKHGIPVYIYDVTTDIDKDVPTNVLIHFLYYLSNIQQLNVLKLLSAYLLSHPQGVNISKHNDQILGSELSYLQSHRPLQSSSTRVDSSKRRPSAEELLRQGSLVSEE